ncbi:MAG: GTPase/DUF3482 domain-containing protein [Neisseria sp.]|nr:GTPase/DUF3482 domain-containing protein [Neisseria sp.]
MSKPLNLAVVGHTNTGKTSLLRTLLRDGEFGEVKNAAATTRHVERASIVDGEQTFVYLFDTPGLEDAGGVLDWLEQHTSPRADGIERIEAFLASEASAGDFNQEAKVLRQLLQSEVALYVIDAREPVLAKYKDELSVLSWCAKPVMPVFNFIAEQDLSEWVEMLARRSLHVYSSFDTVAFDFEGEMRLWDNLAAMGTQREVLDNLMHTRRKEWAQLDEQARLQISHFLLNIAAYKQEIDEDEDNSATFNQMQNTVRQLERQLHHQLFQLYRFYQPSLTLADLELKTLRQDPFDLDLLQNYGIRTGKGAATGALLGMGIDIISLGGTLGLGTAIGSVIGGVLPNVQSISDKLQGKQTLFLDAATLTLLAARALEVLQALQARGHAAQQAVVVQNQHAPWQNGELPSALNKARSREKWSALNGYSEPSAQEARAEYAEQLSRTLKSG